MHSLVLSPPPRSSYPSRGRRPPLCTTVVALCHLRPDQEFRNRMKVGSGVRFDAQGFPVGGEGDPVVAAARKPKVKSLFPRAVFYTWRREHTGSFLATAPDSRCAFSGTPMAYYSAPGPCMPNLNVGHQGIRTKEHLLIEISRCYSYFSSVHMRQVDATRHLPPVRAASFSHPIVVKL